ncbi:MAG: hypothetical protein C0485_16330, partial [Pirellula sp.]|nr:hypothetical protein [Pirellula sp.]
MASILGRRYLRCHHGGMCHHYRGQKNAPEFYIGEFSIRVNLALLTPELMAPEKGYWPLKDVPVIRLEHGDRALAVCKWGLLPSWWKPKKEDEKPDATQKGMYNAKSETVDTKPSYRSAFKSRRCLLLGAKFEEKGHYFSLPDDRPFAFAGLWESWHDGEIVSCTMLTTEPNEEVRGVGHHR